MLISLKNKSMEKVILVNSAWKLGWYLFAMWLPQRLNLYNKSSNATVIWYEIYELDCSSSSKILQIQVRFVCFTYFENFHLPVAVLVTMKITAVQNSFTLNFLVLVNSVLYQWDFLPQSFWSFDQSCIADEMHDLIFTWCNWGNSQKWLLFLVL